jgi:hypothetical protein
MAGLEDVSARARRRGLDGGGGAGLDGDTGEVRQRWCAAWLGMRSTAVMILN